jgi:hypothetical protein
MDGSAEGFEIVHYTPCSLIKCKDSGTTYTLVAEAADRFQSRAGSSFRYNQPSIGN